MQEMWIVPLVRFELLFGVLNIEAQEANAFSSRREDD